MKVHVVLVDLYITDWTWMLLPYTFISIESGCCLPVHRLKVDVGVSQIPHSSPPAFSLSL